MINVKINVFEGPFELLFHLIEKNKLDIYDIPITELTDQYMAYLQELPEENLDSLSQFLYMAATLLEIKSKMLLPLPVPAGNDEPEDPREILVHRLIEYKRFKTAAEGLKGQKDLGERYLYRMEEPLKFERIPPDPDAILNDLSLQDLHDIFEDMLKRRELKIDKIRSSFNAIQKDSYTIEMKIQFLKDMLRDCRTVHLLELLSQSSCRSEQVVTFLALLELIRINQVQVRQEGTFEEIEITAFTGDVKTI